MKYKVSVLLAIVISYFPFLISVSYAENAGRLDHLTIQVIEHDQLPDDIIEVIELPSSASSTVNPGPNARQKSIGKAKPGNTAKTPPKDSRHSDADNFPPEISPGINSENPHLIYAPGTAESERVELPPEFHPEIPLVLPSELPLELPPEPKPEVPIPEAPIVIH